jgi:hypothetical protein
MTVMDPFCGTGTTLVEAKKCGLHSMGVEAVPMAYLATRTKTDWSIDGEMLLSAGHDIGRLATSELALDGLDDLQLDGVAERRSLYGLRCLDEEAEGLLLAGSISPLPLHRALVLKNAITCAASPEIRSHLLLALAWTLVNEAGNLKFGPEVGVTKPQADVDVVGSWMRQVQRMSEDLFECAAAQPTTSTAWQGDSREIAEILPPESVDLLITSPPYPNEKDYTRTTRLESVVLGLVQTKADLRELKKTLVRSNTRSVYVTDRDDAHVESFQEIQRLAEQIEDRRKELGKTSGFERLYHRVTKLYFGGMKRHLESLRGVLKPGARLAYVVGDQASYLRVMVRTGSLLAEIAQSLGYKVEGVDLFRTRYSTATREQLREEVVILRWNP